MASSAQTSCTRSLTVAITVRPACFHADIELSSMDSVSSRLRELSPGLVVNTAAMHHVDKCELEPDKAFAVNGIGARNLAIVSRDLGAVLMHVSTDYVFDGAQQTPYEEQDAPRPLNVYGNTKLAGEYFVTRSTTEKHFRKLLRTSAIYGKARAAPRVGSTLSS